MEDAVQGALLAALSAWVKSGIPDDASAWLQRVAQNNLLGVLRQDQAHRHILDRAGEQAADDVEEPMAPAFAGKIAASGTQNACIGAPHGWRAAHSDTFTRFHAEAGVVAEHCFAPSFADTRWSKIAELYAMLEGIDPSPIYTPNRAVAVAEAQGPEAGLAVLDGMVPPPWLDGHYLWDAVLADLHHRTGNAIAAARHREQALAAAPSPAVRQLLQRWLTKPRR